MFVPFRLKEPISRSYPADPGDVRETKRALADFGLFKLPEWGITPYPDEKMF